MVFVEVAAKIVFEELCQKMQHNPKDILEDTFECQWTSGEDSSPLLFRKENDELVALVKQSLTRTIVL